jgi:hypothetical protein
MSEIEFVIQDNVEIPKREFAGERATRESEYPFAKMKAGQSFAIGIKGEAGTKVKGKDGVETVLTEAESAKRHAAQKQSYFSSLGKRLGIDIVTRYFPNGEGDDGQPTLRAWHNGPRKEKTPKNPKAAKATTAEAAGASSAAQAGDDDSLDL